MLYDPSRIGNAAAELFEAQYWRARGAVSSTPGGRGDAQFVEDAGRSWVLRHYRRGGWAARLSKDGYFWTGEARTRPFREWRLLSELYRAGLPVPAPVAARYQRHGLKYTGDLITERILGAQPLSMVLGQRTLPAEVWRAVGQCVRRFHDAGIYHADLNAHNVLIAEADARNAGGNAEGVFLIDFDRGCRRSGGPWKDNNLARLRRSLDKIARAMPAGRFAAEHWTAVLQGYGVRFAASPP